MGSEAPSQALAAKPASPHPCFQVDPSGRDMWECFLKREKAETLSSREKVRYHFCPVLLRRNKRTLLKTQSGLALAIFQVPAMAQFLFKMGSGIWDK